VQKGKIFIHINGYIYARHGRSRSNNENRDDEETTGNRAKIIAITANESEESVKRCYDSGMDDYLVKPFTLEILKEKLV
jgi:CheY-like chemotaxis protein